ncbi:MAG: hypothetical protein ACTS8S_03645 [Giesbergeria sp.]
MKIEVTGTTDRELKEHADGRVCIQAFEDGGVEITDVSGMMTTRVRLHAKETRLIAASLWHVDLNGTSVTKKVPGDW